MKAFKLTILSFLFSSSVFALDITNVTVIPASSNQIQVVLDTFDGYSYEFNTHNVTFNGNTITLSVCYNMGVFPAGWCDTQSFDISMDNISIMNYTLVVNVYYYNYDSQSCDFINFQDTATLMFSAPLAGPVNLNTVSYDQNNAFEIYPNPTSDFLNINYKAITKSAVIEFVDFAGRIVKSQRLQHSNEQHAIDIRSLSKGIYVLRLKENNKILSSKKLIIN
ncbi:T9SS type A sorting domain-containing protein [Flavobacterium sp.]|uniref:T9SS type A sorting domain-containing protein n=1 Tax=Flavobacterium sp. TaxID=239 RepID=UPI002614CF1F|nr:T9SS type A sorting domain-containing protein [Flavobacterium sp.]